MILKIFASGSRVASYRGLKTIAKKSEITHIESDRDRLRTVAQKCHGNFNLLTAVSISLTAVSISLMMKLEWISANIGHAWLSSSMGNSEVRCEAVNYICHLANQTANFVLNFVISE